MRDLASAFKLSDLAVAFVVLAIIMLIIIPLSTVMMDFLIVINLLISVMILLAAIYAKSALQFSSLPTLLLMVTLFRLALNLSSTRLILSNNGDAGNMIKAFGSFVIGNNIIIGAVVFIIIMIIQFMVITKGSERVSEVTARFTLDAMPGKQMAIDADLNAGMIDEQEAKERRMDIQRQADFYGAMDGASKFVKGDATAGILITFINIIGGIVIGALGLAGKPMSIQEVVPLYTMATIGDGLCSQLPALLVSTATGILVTRSASDDSLGGDLQSQLFSNPLVMMIASAMLMFIGLIPGLPKLPIYILAAILLFIGYRSWQKSMEPEPILDQDAATEAIADEKRKPESVASLLQVEPIELELGYGLLPLAATAQGGDLRDRVVMIRRQFAQDIGIIVPVIHMRDNIHLSTHEYAIKIKGQDVARGEVMPDRFLALNAGNATGEVDGISTTEPAFGLPALWITQATRERAELLGYTTIDPPSVIATHLTNVLRRHCYELIGRQQVQTLLDNLKRAQPVLVDEVVPKMFGLGEIQKVLSNLLREGISIRDMGTIIETMADYGTLTRDTDLLTEYVRQALKRAISKRFVPDNRARVITLSPNLEQMIVDRVRQSEQGSYVAMEPEHLQKVFVNLKNAVERMSGMGLTPMVLTSPMVRKHFKKITEQLVPDLVVLSYNELEQSVEIYADGVVNI